MMTVATAFTMLTVIVVMLVMIVIVVVMLVIVMMAMATAFAMLTVIVMMVVMIVTVVMVMLMLLLKRLYSILESILMLHSNENILAVKIIPRGSYYNCIGIMLTKKGYAFGYLLFPCSLGVRKNDGRCMLDLVIIEFAEILHIHLALINVGNGGKAIKNSAVLLCSFSRTNNVRKLTNTRGLNNNSIRSVFLKHLYKRLRKVTYERATDATGIHLGNLNSSIGKESTVNTDLTKLVLNKNNLFTGIRLLNKLLDQRGLACTEEAGKYIYFSHLSSPQTIFL